MNKYRIVILGSGNIGTDLLIKVKRSDILECVAFVGRGYSSPGMIKAQSMGVLCSDQSISYIEQNADKIDLVFDATSAKDHLIHSEIIKRLGLKVIDLTPAKVGKMCVPAVNMKDCLNEWNLNMVTCGGQASIPIAYAIGQSQKNIEYVEVVSSIASKSAGPATRINLDEYIATTEKGVEIFSGAVKTKAILNLNPAIPCIDMQTTVFAKVENPDLDALKSVLSVIIDNVKAYVPGYSLLVDPIIENERIVVMVRVRGLG
ncbi:MAG TPA: acetaldehyde dehydrogenase (acetylating), partial [Spirochaetota bacterium]|nr:acetaldehyde dehydrogenase (acetylating) [Spirochaetota bacterium]